MRLFDKRTPLQKEWDKLEVQEQRFLQKRSEKRESILNQKLEEKIPPKLQKTLDTAFAKAFAGKMNAVVAITGAIDIVADAEKAYCIYNGRPEMSSITGTGCQLSALTAAFVTANQEQPLEAAAAAVCAMGLAGETAYARLSELDGNATYRNYIIDAIYRMNGEALEAGAKFEVR